MGHLTLMLLTSLSSISKLGNGRYSVSATGILGCISH
jgi:hypothetical protein